VVTGASRRQGIGFAIARRLASAGTSILVHGWPAADEIPDPGDMTAVVDELRATGAQIETTEADFSDPSAPAAVIGAAGQPRPHRRGLARGPRAGPCH
jgi:3-oxoacyl-[acyl-carrier protein] reductase